MYHWCLLATGVLIILLSLRTESQVMLSPSGDVPVCPGSRPSFTCSTNLSFIEWNITTSKPDTRRRLVTPGTKLELDIIIREHIFNITRSSAEDSYPLISVLTVFNAVAGLNSTKIKCTEIENSLAESSESMAIINIVNSYPDSPTVTAPRILEFRTDIFIVLFNWNQSQYHRNHISYHVDVIPQHLVHNNIMITQTSNTSVQLQLSYNTYYNVSVTAILCGQRNATTIVSLDFVKCVHPLLLPTIDDSLRVFLDSDPALVGTNATFSCLPEQEFSGPRYSTCMENGEWKPDPREVDCIAICGPPSLPSSGYIFPYTSTSSGAIVNFACQRSVLNQDENITVIAAICNKLGRWDPNPAEFCNGASGINQGTLIAAAVASSTAAVIITLVFSIIGFCCGYFHRNRKRKIKKRKKPRPRKPTPPPKELYYNLDHPLKRESGIELMLPNRAMYDDVILPPMASEQDLKQGNTKPKVMYDEVLPPSEQNPVELKKNSAYRPADTK